MNESTTVTPSPDDWLDTGAEDDWLDTDPLTIEDPNEGKTPFKFRQMVDTCMRGTNRVMATAGNYVAYRPYNRAFDKETNPRTMERMSMFRSAGNMKHLGTYDEVEIYEFLPGSPYYHDGNKAYVVGQNYWGDIRAAATLACERKWAEYHDYLQVMATALKAGRDPMFARTMWDDTVNQVAIAIKQIGGAAAPTEKEVNEGFTGIRRLRGISKGGVIATLNSAALTKVGF